MRLKSTWRTRFAALATMLVAFTGSAGAQAASGPTKQLEPSDLKAWKTIRQSALSPDGKWFAYVIAPNEGNATLVLRSTGTDAKETKFPIGEAGGGRGAGGAPGADAGGAGASLAISGDSKWLAFTIYPASTAGQSGRAGRGGNGARGGATQQPGGAAAAGPQQNKLGLVNIATGEKKEFDRVRRFAFNGDKPTWLAMQSYPETSPATGDAAATAPAGRGGRGGRGGAPADAGGAAPAGRAEGTDLVLYSLAGGELANVGNVAEFGFDDSGDWLAYTIDARDQIGNGVQLRNMRTDVVRAIDSDRALYRRLVWSDSLGALAVLRGKIDSTARDTLFSIVTFTKVASGTPAKAVFDPSAHSEFPSTMKIAVDRAPRLADDLSAVFFAIRPANPRTAGDGGTGARQRRRAGGGAW